MLSVAERSGLNMQIEPGTTVQNVILEAINCDRNTTIEFVGEPGITFEITGFEDKDKTQFFTLKITAASDAPLGNRSVLLKNLDPDALPTFLNLLKRLKNPDPKNSIDLAQIDLNEYYYHGPAVFGLLTVVSPGTLRRTTLPIVAAMAEFSPVEMAVQSVTVSRSVELRTRR